MLAEAAPMSCAGTVLSQPPISTTASIGCAPIISSVSIAIRLRYIIDVGFRNTSPSEIVGNGRGKAPAASTPRETASTNSSVVRWQLLRTRWRHRDADDRLGQHLARQAHGAGERAAQIAGEVRVAVIGQSASDAGCLVCHTRHLCVQDRLRYWMPSRSSNTCTMAPLSCGPRPAQEGGLIGCRGGGQDRHRHAFLRAQLGAAHQVLVGLRHWIAVREMPA